MKIYKSCFTCKHFPYNIDICNQYYICSNHSCWSPIPDNVQILLHSIKQQEEIEKENKSNKVLKLFFIFMAILLIISLCFNITYEKAEVKPEVFMAILLIISLCFNITYDKAEVKPEVVIKDTTKQISTDTIPILDKKILNDLIPILQKREGLKLTPYKAKGGIYVGYGHKILQSENNLFYGLKDSIQATELLVKDIRNAYFEHQRILRKTLSKDIYNIFIKGKE